MRKVGPPVSANLIRTTISLAAYHQQRRECKADTGTAHAFFDELRFRLGVGKPPEDALLFANLEGAPLSRNAISCAWSYFAASIQLPDVTFHALRHTHASQLIDAGVDIVTISKRLGHAKPDITLRIYAHLFQESDGKAAAAINSILSS